MNKSNLHLEAIVSGTKSGLHLEVVDSTTNSRLHLEVIDSTTNSRSHLEIIDSATKSGSHVIRPQTTVLVTNRVPVAPFALKLSQNESYGLQEPFRTPPGPP